MLALVAASFIPASVFAQTTVVVNPRTLTFTPSADHNATLSDGRPAIDHYNFDVYSVGAAQPFQSTSIGKPSPASDGLIYYDFSASVGGWPLPGGNYEARVVAVGPMGSGTSGPSNPFTFSSCTYALSGTSASLPAAGGGTQVSVTTASGCAWTAASNVSWVVVSPTSATGNATVVATVAANTATSSRTATLTVAGQAFTISQAGTAVSAPSAPASPSPASGATGVSATPTLTWAASSGAASYSVAFGTTNPPPQAASGLASASYTPGALAGATTYYWRVTATNSGGSTTGSTWSFTTAGTSTPPPTTALPSPWRNQDVGNVVLPGSATSSNGTFTVAGSGADIWGTADAFQYVNQPVTGNVEIVARVTGEQNTNAYAKAGLMLREALTAGSAHVILDIVPGGGIEFMTRSSAGASTTYLAGSTQAVPAWLKLSRVGSTVTGSVSADGATWLTVGSTTVGMATTGYAGLAVTSHNTAVTNTSTFDNVAVTALGSTGLPAGWSNQDVGSVGLAGSTAYAAGRYTVTGAGADIWGTTDAFQYAWRALSGDGQIVARVTSLQNTNTYAKAGVMARSALTANSAHVILDLVPNGGVEFMTRSVSGGSTAYLGGATQATPCWLQLVRTGSTVTASVSADGTTWRTVGSTTLPSGAAYVGLVVTSHDTTLRNTATFDNVTVR